MSMYLLLCYMIPIVQTLYIQFFTQPIEELLVIFFVPPKSAWNLFEMRSQRGQEFLGFQHPINHQYTYFSLSFLFSLHLQFQESSSNVNSKKKEISIFF